MGLINKFVKEAVSFVDGKGYYCSVCKKTITRKEYEFSKSRFKRALCRYHQKNFKSNKIVSKGKKMYGYPKAVKRKSTPEARKLYYALSSRGVPVELEKWDGHKHIDIAITHAKVNIEVDGAQHNFSYKQALSDLKRTYHSFRKGFLTLRVPNSLIKNHFEETVDCIVDFLNESRSQLEDEY